jgi:hypothetical protein
MANVVISWITQDEIIPNAASFTQYQVSLVDASGASAGQANEPLASRSHTFLNIAAGNYTASVALVDPAGVVALPPVSGPVVVPSQPSAPVPISLSVILS